MRERLRLRLQLGFAVFVEGGEELEDEVGALLEEGGEGRVAHDLGEVVAGEGHAGVSEVVGFDSRRELEERGDVFGGDGGFEGRLEVFDEVLVGGLGEEEVLGDDGLGGDVLDEFQGGLARARKGCEGRVAEPLLGLGLGDEVGRLGDGAEGLDEARDVVEAQARLDGGLDPDVELGDLEARGRVEKALRLRVVLGVVRQVARTGAQQGYEGRYEA